VQIRTSSIGRLAAAAIALALSCSASAAAATAAVPGTSPVASQAQTPLTPPAWSDEFDSGSLDLTRWSHRATGPRHDGVITPDAVSVSDGVLTIRTYTEEGTHYSGMISTQKHGSGGFEQRYGYFEARVKFNSSPGQWSAFWLQSPTVGHPVGDPETAGVEMDIAEHRARCVTVAPADACAADNDIRNRAQQALIWDGYGADRKAEANLSPELPGLGNDSWHTWALRWTPTEVTFYYDGAAIWSRTGPISRRSQHIILSSEVGRFFAGEIPAAGYGSSATSSTNMQVDYVRAWEMAGPGSATPPTSGDTTAPDAEIVGSTARTVGRSLAVTVRCPDEDCRATATATVFVPKLGRAAARTFRPTPSTAAIAKGMTGAFRLKLSRGARAAIARALKARKRVVLKVRIRVADSAGNTRVRTRRVMLER